MKMFIVFSDKKSEGFGIEYLLPFVLLLFVGASFAQTPTYSNLDYVGRGNVKQMLDL